MHGDGYSDSQPSSFAVSFISLRFRNWGVASLFLRFFSLSFDLIFECVFFDNFTFLASSSQGLCPKLESAKCLCFLCAPFIFDKEIFLKDVETSRNIEVCSLSLLSTLDSDVSF